VVLLAACSRLSLPEPQTPSTTPPATQVAAARDWFAQAASAAAKPAAINWAKAHAFDGCLLIPLADTTNPFTAEHKRAYRYLVAQNTAGNAFTGRIVELVLEGKAPAASTVEQAVVAATKRLLATPQAPAPLPGLTGLLLFYSPAYQYETGFVYDRGVAQAQRVRLARQVKNAAAPAARPSGSIDNESACIIEMRCGYVNGELANCIYVLHCDEGIGGGGGGDSGGWGGGGGGASTPTQPTQTNTIDQSQLKICQTQVLQRLQTASGTALLGIVKLFSGAEPGYNWIVKDGILSANTYGETISLYDTSTRSVTTTFDASKWGDATDLSIARTMLHEAIHAYLVAYFANSRYALSPNATFGEMITAYNAASLAGQEPNLNVIHHNEMAYGGNGNGWIGDVAWSLKQYGLQQGYKLSDQFYMDMAWGGLTETSAFLKLPASDQTRILNTILTELSGKDINDKPVKQVGNTAGC
jgi:hypothetical protein